MTHAEKFMTIGDIVTSALSATIVVALFGDVVAWMHFSGDFVTALAQYTDWYTRGAGAVVVTVNGYLLWRKYRKIKQMEKDR